MVDTSLSWMRMKSGCLLLHQESNADPMEKAIAKSAIFKANQFEIGTFKINKSWQPTSWIEYMIFLTAFKWPWHGSFINIANLL
jgi:hypothetical protein